MGIDVYLRWDNQTETERQKQYTGFSITSGDVGYLREAYHGGPYGTMVLAPEAFNDDTCEAVIPAETLRARLPKALAAVAKRSRTVYHDDAAPEVLKAFTDFVELAELKERETGQPCTIYASY